MNIRQADRPQRMRGFTLIEIMVVIVIIGLIVGIVAPGIIGQLSKAEIVRAQADIKSISTALDFFRTYHYRYPTDDEGLDILLGDIEIDGRPVDKLLQATPIDPWGRPYYYEYPSTQGDEYDVYTLGADGEEGGEGANADIGTWNVNAAR